MMRLLIPVLLALVGLGAGVGAALVLRPDPGLVGGVASGAGGVEVTAARRDAGSVPALPATHGATDKDDAQAADSEYTELGDQFVVPVVEDGRVKALVVLTLSVETVPGFGDEILAHAPKLRDVFLRELLDHANLGGFKGAFTSNGAMDRLRQALRESGQKTMGKDLRDVLILDINRQELS